MMQYDIRGKIKKNNVNKSVLNVENFTLFSFSVKIIEK
jgi:hypothetical protein